MYNARTQSLGPTLCEPVLNLPISSNITGYMYYTGNSLAQASRVKSCLVTRLEEKLRGLKRRTAFRDTAQL